MKILPNEITELSTKDQMIRVIKESDNRFGNDHPNGINEGYIFEGKCSHNIKVGERTELTTYSGRYFRSSVVTKIKNGNIFMTENSTYRIEIL